MFSGIYKIVVANKIYVGSAFDIKRRWRKHKEQFRWSRHPNNLMQKAWNKHGEIAFEFIIIEQVNDLRNLSEREQYWMDFYKSYDTRLSAITYRLWLVVL